MGEIIAIIQGLATVVVIMLSLIGLVLGERKVLKNTLMFVRVWVGLTMILMLVDIGRVTPNISWMWTTVAVCTAISLIRLRTVKETE